MLPGVSASLHLVGLIFPVHRFLHALQEQAVLVAGEQRIPIGAPDHLDDVPAGSPEHGLQFLDDLAVAAHRTVQALEVAVHDEDQVVQVLPGREGDGAQGLGLVHFPVAHEGPDLAAGCIQQLPILQVAHETGLVDGHHG